MNAVLQSTLPHSRLLLERGKKLIENAVKVFDTSQNTGVRKNSTASSYQMTADDAWIVFNHNISDFLVSYLSACENSELVLLIANNSFSERIHESVEYFDRLLGIY